MDSKEQRSALRAAVYRGDGPAVVHLLQGAGNYDDAVQLAGDGLMAAVIQRVEGAPELVRDRVLALRRRGWDGDDDLASQLDAMLGTGPAPMLRALPVDLDELAAILEGDPLHGDGRIDPKAVGGAPDRSKRSPPGRGRGPGGCSFPLRGVVTLRRELC
jgi:hypothetical protein